LNDYRPLLQITFSGSLLEMVSRPSDWINMKFDISKASINSLGDCTCGAQDCYTVGYPCNVTFSICYQIWNVTFNYLQNTYFVSGGIQDSYLSESLFQENVNINALNDNIFSYDHHISKFSGKKLGFIKTY